MADVTVPTEYLEAYAATLRDLDGVARSLLVDSLANVDLSDRAAVVATVKAVCRTGGEAATRLSEQFYRGMSMLQTGVDPKVAVRYAYDPKATAIALSAIMRDAEDEEELLRQLGDRVSYETNRAAKLGVWSAGQADGRDVRYARVPMGAETCAWCLMTAGLGYWYMSYEAASHTHRSCDCMIVPSIGRGDVTIPGYDSTVYRDMWRSANKDRASGNIPDDLKARIAAEKERKGKDYRLDTNGTLAVMRWKYGLS